MAIKQTIQYNAHNRYFAGFLQDLINESGILGSVAQSEKEIVLFLDESDTRALNRFSSLVTNYLPHSLFVGDIKTIREEREFVPSKFTSPTYAISLCKKCLEQLTNPASPNYLDDTIECHHYANSDSAQHKDTSIYSAHYSEGDTLLVVDSQKVHELFVMTQDEVQALFSIEKPTLKVTIKDETLKELSGKKFLNIKSPESVRSTLVALNAKESGVPYLFFEYKHDLKVLVIQKNVTIIEEKRALLQELEELHSFKDVNRFLNISKEAGSFQNAIGASLSLKHGISFMVSGEKESRKVLSLTPFILKDVLELMQKDEKKAKLLLNFEKKYPTIIKEFSQNPNYGMFESLACILELKTKSFEAVSDKSLEFRGNGGLKIDTFFTDTGFDYVSFIGSIMSFKLAATQEHYLAYSTFEALGDMVIATCNQLKTKYKIENFVMMGNIFENSVLFSRILSKFQLSHPHFSKAFALDD